LGGIKNIRNSVGCIFKYSKSINQSNSGMARHLKFVRLKCIHAE
jgi:hypothetical protein